MFNRNSHLVKIWFGAVMIGQYDISEVPNISNLREVVQELYDEATGPKAETPTEPQAEEATA